MIEYILSNYNAYFPMGIFILMPVILLLTFLGTPKPVFWLLMDKLALRLFIEADMKKGILVIIQAIPRIDRSDAMFAF